MSILIDPSLSLMISERNLAYTLINEGIWVLILSNLFHYSSAFEFATLILYPNSLSLPKSGCSSLNYDQNSTWSIVLFSILPLQILSWFYTDNSLTISLDPDWSFCPSKVVLFSIKSFSITYLYLKIINSSSNIGRSLSAFSNSCRAC